MGTLRDLEEKFPRGLEFLKKKDVSSFFLEGFGIRLFDNPFKLCFELLIWNRKLTVRQLRIENKTKDITAKSLHSLSYFKITDQEIDRFRELVNRSQSMSIMTTMVELNDKIMEVFDRFESEEQREPLPDEKNIDAEAAIQLLDQGEWAVKVFDNVPRMCYEVVFWHRRKRAGPHILPIYYQKIDPQIEKKFATKGKMADPLHTWHTSGLLRELILAFGGPIQST